MSEQQPTQEEGENPSRAIDALERAVVIAETGALDRPILVARPADWHRAIGGSLSRRPLAARSGHDGTRSRGGLDALLACGALDCFCPRSQKLVGFGDGEWRHKDVWKHTKQVVRQAVPRVEVRWAALLHDVGKVKTRSISATGEVHFFGHAEVGARMFDKLNRRLPLFTTSPRCSRRVRFLILHHLRANQYEGDWTDSAVRRFAREMGGHLDDLLCLSRADITTKRPEKKKRGLEQISEFAERIRTLAEQDAVIPPLPSGIGDAIMKSFQLPLRGSSARSSARWKQRWKLAKSLPGSSPRRTSSF